MDYCSALYFGVSQSFLPRLQLVQNAAARLLTGARKKNPVTPILASLHWLLCTSEFILNFFYLFLNP